MIIKFNGTMNTEQLVKNIEGIVSDIIERAGIESKDIKITDARVGVLFTADTNPQYLVVTHDDVPEIFEVNVKLNDAGEIDRTVDNEKESFHDDYTRAVANGEESPITEEIESVFDDEDLEQTEVIDAGDLQEVHYKLKDLDGTQDTVIRYYRNGVLVGEALAKHKKEY